jgi:hydrogenase nickel incorporation protein HypA/HybF
MHELRIAESIVNIALREMERNKIAAVTAVGIRVGVISGVNPSALEFSFDAITTATPLAGAKLKIEEIPARGSCRACRKSFEIAEFIFVCPFCYSGDIELREGEELDVAYLEAE